MLTNDIKNKAKVNAYLNRIGFEGELDGSIECLNRLQECHLHTVPYENLDILYGTPLSLEIEAAFDKIVTRRRGGYCFELNALFGWLLEQLGYDVENYFARFWRDEPNPPPKRRHHVLKVEIGGQRYLCDVGVGGIVPRKSVMMQEGLIQAQGEESYKLERVPVYGWMLYELKKDAWLPIYSYTEEPQLSNDYTMASFWCEHAPDSIFRKQAMAAIRTRTGRNTLSGNEFRIFTDNGVQTFVPISDEQYKEALNTYFGIDLSR